jgi:hypothetical protein
MNELVYIAGKHTCPTKKEKEQCIIKAHAAAFELLKLGFVPITPHILTLNFEYYDPFSNWKRKDWINQFCLPLLKNCEYIYLINNYTESEGSLMEVQFAINNNIKFLNVGNYII